MIAFYAISTESSDTYIPQTTVPMSAAANLETHIPTPNGDLIFTGGIDLGKNYNRINPESAMPNIDGNIEIVEWLITTQNRETVLKSDGDTSLEDGLKNLRESRAAGVHYIIFRFECELGFVHRVGGSFMIFDNSVIYNNDYPQKAWVSF